MTSKIAHPPLDPKLGHVRQVSSQQKVFYKRPSSAMPRMKPALSRQRSHGKPRAQPGARAGSAVTRDASGSHGPTATRNQRKLAGSKARSPKSRQKESMNLVDHKVDNFVTAPDNRVDKPILMQRPSSAAVLSSLNPTNATTDYQTSTLLPNITASGQQPNPALEQLISHLAQAQAQTQRQPQNLQQTREVNLPAEISPPGQPQQITLQWHNKIHHNYYGGCNNHNYQNTALEPALIPGEPAETFHVHPGSSRMPQNRGPNESRDGQMPRELNPVTGDNAYRSTRAQDTGNSRHGRRGPGIKGASKTRAKNLRRRPLGEKKFTEDLSSDSGQPLSSDEHSRSYNASQSGATSPLLMPAPNTVLARRLAVMEYLENSNNPNVFRQLKMDRLAEETNGKLLEGTSKDAKQKLTLQKRQLKMMLQQDKQRRSSNSRPDHADLDGSAEPVEGLGAPAMRHRNKSVGFLRDTKSASKAEKERIQRSAQYQQLLKMQAKQQETNYIQAVAREKSAQLDTKTNQASKSKKSRSRSASSPSIERRANAVTKLNLNPLATSGFKDARHHKALKHLSKVKLVRQKNSKPHKQGDSEKVKINRKRSRLSPSNGSPQQLGNHWPTPTKGPSFSEITELGKRAIDLKNLQRGESHSPSAAERQPGDHSELHEGQPEKQIVDWESHLLEPDQFQLNHLQELLLRQSSETFDHPQRWGSAGQLDPRARLLAMQDYLQKGSPQRASEKSPMMSLTMPHLRPREAPEQPGGPPSQNNRDTELARADHTLRSSRTHAATNEDRNINDQPIDQNPERADSDGQSQERSRALSTSAMNTDLSERASCPSAHGPPQGRDKAKPDSQSMSVNSRGAPTFSGSKLGEYQNQQCSKRSSKKDARADVGKVSSTNRNGDLQLAGKDLQRDRPHLFMRAQTITASKQNYPKMFFNDGSQSIDEQKNDKAIYSEQQDSIKNHHEANSSAVVTSNKLTGVPISVHQIPLQVQEEADKTASASNNRSSNMPSNVFLNVDAHSRDELRSPTNQLQQQSHSGLTGRQSVGPASNEHSERQNGHNSNDRAFKPQFTAVQELEIQERPALGQFASQTYTQADLKHSAIIPEQQTNTVDDRKEEARDFKASPVPSLDLRQMRPGDHVDPNYNSDQFLAQLIRQKLLSGDREDIVARSAPPDEAPVGSAQASTSKRQIGIRTGDLESQTCLGGGASRQAGSPSCPQSLVRQCLAEIYDKAVDAVVDEASSSIAPSQNKAKRAANRTVKPATMQSRASEVLGLDQDQLDPEAIDYEATHPADTARSGQTEDPSREIEINSLRSVDEDPASPHDNFIALFEKHQSEIHVQRKERNTVPLPAVSAMTENDKKTSEPETLSSESLSTRNQPSQNQQRAPGPGKLNVQVDLGDPAIQAHRTDGSSPMNPGMPSRAGLRSQKTTFSRKHGKQPESPDSTKKKLMQMHTAKSEANLLKQKGAGKSKAGSPGHAPAQSPIYQSPLFQPQMSLLPFSPYGALPQLQALHHMHSTLAGQGLLFPLEEEDKFEAQVRHLLWTAPARARKMKGFRRMQCSDATMAKLEVPVQARGATEPNVSFANMSTFKDNQQLVTPADSNKVPRIRLSQVDSLGTNGRRSQDRGQDTSVHGIHMAQQAFLNTIFKPQYSVKPLSRRLRLDAGYYQPITVDVFVDDCRLTRRAVEEEHSLHGCFEDGPSPINGPQLQYQNIYRDDSPLTANGKPLDTAYVVIGESYYKVKDMVAQDELSTNLLPAEHSEGGSSQAKEYQTVLDAASDGEEDVLRQGQPALAKKRRDKGPTAGLSSAMSSLKQTPTGTAEKKVDFDVDTPAATRSEQWKKEDARLDAPDAKRGPAQRALRFAPGSEPPIAEAERAATDQASSPAYKRASTSLSAFHRQEEARRGASATQKQQKWWTELIEEYQDNKNNIGNDEAQANDMSLSQEGTLSATSQWAAQQERQYWSLYKDDYGFSHMGLVNLTRKESLLEEERVMQLFKPKRQKIVNRDFGRRNSSVDGYSIGSGRPLGAGRRLQFASTRQQSAYIGASRRPGSEYSYNMDLSFANCSEYFQVLEDDFPIDAQLVGDFYRKTKKRALHSQADHEKLDPQYDAFAGSQVAESLVGRLAQRQKRDQREAKAYDDKPPSRPSLAHQLNRSQTSMLRFSQKSSFASRRKPGTRKLVKLQSQQILPGSFKAVSPDASKRLKKDEEDDTFNDTYLKLVEILKEEDAINRRRILFLRLFRIAPLVNTSALFVCQKAPLDIEFKLLSRQRFSTKFMAYIKQLITDSGYVRYNTHVWEYSQIGKIAYYVNGHKARTMFRKAIERNPEELRRFYRDSCIDANIPLFRASINQQIQDACFKNKDKLLYTVLYKQTETQTPDCYVQQVLNMIQQQSTFDTPEQWEILKAQNERLANKVRAAYERHCQKEKANARRERQNVIQHERSIRKKPAHLDRYEVSQLLYFINFHKPGPKEDGKPEEPWVHHEYMEGLKKSGGKQLTAYRPSENALELPEVKLRQLVGEKQLSGPVNNKKLHISAIPVKQGMQSSRASPAQEMNPGQAEFPFKLNDYFGYRSLIISQGFYQIFEPQLAPVRRQTTGLPQQQSAEGKEGRLSARLAKSSTVIQNQGLSSFFSIKNKSTAKTKSIRPKGRKIAADSFGKAVEDSNQALERQEIESNQGTEPMESEIEDEEDQYGEDCSPITFHKAADKPQSSKQRQSTHGLSEKSSTLKPQGSVSSLKPSISRKTPTNHSQRLSGGPGSESSQPHGNQIVVTCVDVDDKEPDEEQFGRARTMQSDKRSMRQGPSGQPQLQQELGNQESNFRNRSKTKLLLTGNMMREELGMIYEEESQLNSQRDSHRYSSNIKKISKHHKKPSSVDFNNNSGKNSGENRLEERPQNSESCSSQAFSDDEDESLGGGGHKGKSPLQNDTDEDDRDRVSGPHKFVGVGSSKRANVRKQLQLLASHGEDPATEKRSNARPKIPFGKANRSHESDTMLAVLAQEESDEEAGSSEDKFTMGQDESGSQGDAEASGCRNRALMGAQSEGGLLNQSGIQRLSESSNGPLFQVGGLLRTVEDLARSSTLQGAPKQTGLVSGQAQKKQLGSKRYDMMEQQSRRSQAGKTAANQFEKTKGLPRGASADNIFLENALAQKHTTVVPAKTEKPTLTIIRKISQRTLNKRNQKQEVPSFNIPGNPRRRTIALNNFEPVKRPAKQAKPRVNVKIQPLHPEEYSEEEMSVRQSKTSKGTMNSGITGQMAPEMKQSEGQMMKMTISMNTKAANLLKIKSQDTRRKEKEVFIQSLENREKHKVFHAIERNQPQVVEDFIGRNMMSLNTCTDALGNSLLNVAVQCGCEEIVDALIKNGAYINTQNNQGNTPLHYAISYNFTKLVDLLMESGADETIKNLKRHSPWQGI